MMEIIAVDGGVYPHNNKPRLLGHIYKDVFEPKMFAALKTTVETVLSDTSTDTFNTHRTIFNFNDQRIKIISHAQNGRKQHIMWDLVVDPEWFYQTKDTIKEWSTKKYMDIANPLFSMYVRKFEAVEPLNKEPENWIPFRLQLNEIIYEKWLNAHVDTDCVMYNKDIRDARMMSLTCYFGELAYGGDFWAPTEGGGFVYKPKPNTAIMFNGNQIVHGVSSNMDPDKKVRLAFSTRWVHKDDLYLPGHPDKHLYNVRMN